MAKLQRGLADPNRNPIRTLGSDDLRIRDCICRQLGLIGRDPGDYNIYHLFDYVDWEGIVSVLFDNEAKILNPGPTLTPKPWGHL